MNDDSFAVNVVLRLIGKNYHHALDNAGYMISDPHITYKEQYDLLISVFTSLATNQDYMAKPISRDLHILATILNMNPASLEVYPREKWWSVYIGFNTEADAKPALACLMLNDIQVGKLAVEHHARYQFNLE